MMLLITSPRRYAFTATLPPPRRLRRAEMRRAPRGAGRRQAQYVTPPRHHFHFYAASDYLLPATPRLRLPSRFFSLLLHFSAFA